MPNWTFNRVRGSKKVAQALLDENFRPTFTKVVPTPPELTLLDDFAYEDSDILSGLEEYIYTHSDTKLKEIYERRKPGCSFSVWIDDMLMRFGTDALQTMHKLKKDFDVDNWYDFNNKYYGCKWDANDDYSFDEYDEDTDDISFGTPWCPPEGVINKLADMFPSEEFIWHADEESCAFSVNFIFHGDGTYSEEDVFPEYFTPYIGDEETLLEQLEEAKTIADVHSITKDYLCEGAYYKIEEVDNKAKITVFDWEVDDYSYTASAGDVLFEVEVPINA